MSGILCNFLQRRNEMNLTGYFCRSAAYSQLHYIFIGVGPLLEYNVLAGEIDPSARVMWKKESSIFPLLSWQEENIRG